MPWRVRTGAGSTQAYHPPRPAWPLVLAVAVRIAAWLVVPAGRFASDEESYFQVATALLLRGEQDLFWPPLTGWLIAAARWTLGTDVVTTVRLVWLTLDIACVVAVRALAGRVAMAVCGRETARAARFTAMATAGYALYLPAISHAQFMTSETPALLQVLVVLLLLTTRGAGTGIFAAAGLVAGTLVLTRPSVLPLLVFLPVARWIGADRKARRLVPIVACIVMGTAVIGAAMVRNQVLSGEFTLARNSAYNLYIGNRDMYGEDLDLFSPRATPGQIEFRPQMWSGELEYPVQSPAELQREALGWIADRPGVFVRRAVGRLARVFAPRTDVLELVGGERSAGIFSPASLGLLAVANAQWTVVLFAGIPGLVVLLRLNREWGTTLVATVLGALPLCLIAIAKPRYSFVFDPVLLIGAVLFMSAPRWHWAGLGRGERWLVAALSGFVLWGWTAWLVFAVTSRMAL